MKECVNLFLAQKAQKIVWHDIVLPIHIVSRGTMQRAKLIIEELSDNRRFSRFGRTHHHDPERSLTL